MRGRSGPERVTGAADEFTRSAASSYFTSTADELPSTRESLGKIIEECAAHR
jgi:hypothetical protein